MRETRQSGSEGGEPGLTAGFPYPYFGARGCRRRVQLTRARRVEAASRRFIGRSSAPEILDIRLTGTET